MTVPDNGGLSDLSDLDIRAVGLVGAAANGHEYLLLKSLGGDNMPGDINTTLDLDAIQEQLDKATDAEETVGIFKKLVTEGISFFRGLAKDDRDEDEDEDAETNAAADTDQELDEEQAADQDEEMPPADAEDGLTKAAVEKMFAVQKEQAAALAKAQAELQVTLDKLAKERSERLDQEYLVKARTFSTLATPVTALAKFLRWANEADAEQGAYIEGVLKAADQAVVTSSLFAEFGSSRAAEPEGPFMDMVKERAEKLRAADVELTKAAAEAQAYKEVSRERPELAHAYLAKRQQASGRK